MEKAEAEGTYGGGRGQEALREGSAGRVARRACSTHHHLPEGPKTSTWLLAASSMPQPHSHPGHKRTYRMSKACTPGLALATWMVRSCTGRLESGDSSCCCDSVTVRCTSCC